MRLNSAAVCTWSRRTALVVLFLSVLPVAARSQEWTSTDVGDTGVAGGATLDGNTWTIRGSGADIWSTNDGFQFLHRVSNRTGFIIARIDGVDAAQPFAKAGLMVRAGLDSNAATAVLDVKPDGGLEFMTRGAAGANMQFIAGASSSFPIWLRLGWTGDAVTASTSNDGAHWTILTTAGLSLPLTPEAGVAVTSHDRTQLATACISSLSVGIQESTWTSADIGATGLQGRASEQNGVWTITAAGSDIWSTSDSFQYLYRRVAGDHLSLIAHIDDIQNTHPFAKTGLMLRAGTGAAAATVLLDVTPGGAVELMTRSGDGAEMQYVGGATVTLPVWLQLSWTTGNASPTQVAASVSADGATWTAVAPAVPFTHDSVYDAGVAVTSHDVSKTTTAHVNGLSLLPIGWRSDSVGAASLGTAVIDSQPSDTLITVEGSGSDIWGQADAFQFVRVADPASTALVYRIVSVASANAFAKGGLMVRDGIAASAASVVLDARPDGNVEFMARPCGGCATTYLGGARIVFPAFLSLSREGSTFTARVFSADPTDGTTIGSVEVPMSRAEAGFAVTSHDPGETITAIFDDPAR